VEIDFHFGATYVVARIAGFSHEEADVIATCSQYIDDTVNSGPVNFSTGQAYYRISTAHDLADYHIALPVDERRVWIPFHFLPGNDPSGDHDEEFYNRIVCRPNSRVAQAMASACIERRAAAHGLHLLGITSHVFIDTWAHQGFAGINHPINLASEIVLEEPPDTYGAHWWEALKHGGWKAALPAMTRAVMPRLINRAFPMGHGAVLHFPDHPFRRWHYKDGLGRLVTRNNPQDFLTALDELCKLYRRYIVGDANAVVAGLNASDRDVIARKIVELKAEEGSERLAAWVQAVEQGEFSFGPAQPSYVKSGPGSWKQIALGVSTAKIAPSMKFHYSPAFLSTNWKLFHDAALAHQYSILHDILPRFGICAI